MSGRDRRGRPKPPPGLTEEERREWFRRQRRKWVWEEGDIVILRRREVEGQEGDDGDKNPEQ